MDFRSLRSFGLVRIPDGPTNRSFDLAIRALSIPCLVVGACLGVFAGSETEAEKVERFLRNRGLSAEGQPSEIKSFPEGLVVNEPGAYEGTVLISPIRDDNAYLVGHDGATLKTWRTGTGPGLSAYATKGGGLLRTGNGRERFPDSPFVQGGAGGVLQMYDSTGSKVWDFGLADGEVRLHHDAILLPNGNVLAVAWGRATKDELLAAGRPADEIAPEGTWYTKLLEIEPVMPDGGNVVWTWSSWDHVSSAAGDPNGIDASYWRRRPDDGGPGGRKRAGRGTSAGHPGKLDWMHANSVAYDEKSGHIMISVHGFDEVWIIDRNRPEAGIVYRFGNPNAYGFGDSGDQFLFKQHDAGWIPEGLPGAGNVLVFSNGTSAGANARSWAMELKLPFENGEFLRNEDGSFKRPELIWEYGGTLHEPLHASRLSGAHRLPNGNTLITHGPQGRVFQVTPEKRIVWEYWNEFGELSTGAASPRARDAVRPVFKARMYPYEFLGLSR